MRALAAAVALAAILAGAAPATALEAVRGIVHVHTDLSTGQFTLEELAATADTQGIGALLLAENYLNRVEYGLPPFRALTTVAHEAPSVHGRLHAYLERVARIRAQFPRVLILPGVEVMPHYFWTGSVLASDLHLHDTQKNLLVYGIEDARALGGLPAAGNRAAGVYSLQSVVDALPMLLIIPGLMLLLRTRAHRRRLGRAVIVVRRRSWAPGLLLCLVAVAAAVRGWPFTTDPYATSRSFGVDPHQALIDHVDRLGGATIWSFPEARDAGEQPVGPVRVSWSTEPYGDDLLRSFRYTAFGAVYEDTTRVESPGGGWDRLLREYAAGERSRASWAIGEAGFHDHSAHKQLGTIETVFVVGERTEAGVLDALKRGRMYARQRTPALALDLAAFAVTTAEAAAGLGETVRAAAGTPLAVTAGIAASDGGAHEVRVTLVRNGAVVGAWTGMTPLPVTHHEVAAGAPLVFRLDVRGPSNTRLLANPIFVTP
ncbi:MAG: hypothetical protein WED01_08045 [Candidatus Rokuibacteriota bacterium]